MKFLLPFSLMFVMLPFAAFAEETVCSSADDCPDGFECVMEPCALPACEAGEECDYTCDPVGHCVESYEPSQCESSADCPAGFACIEETIPCATLAVEVDCAPCACSSEDESCECPECEPVEEYYDADCEDQTFRYCGFVPVECASDSDCSAGYECVADEVCSGGGADCACSGCVCEPCTEGEECLPCDCPEEECDCTGEEFEVVCEVLGSYCLPKQVECDDDTDCAAGFECSAMTGTTDCLCPACACLPCDPTTDPECDVECDCAPCDCSEGEVVNYCLPIGWAEMDLVATSGEERTDDTDSQSWVPSENYNTDGNIETAAIAEDEDDKAAEDEDSSAGCSMSSNGSNNLGLFLIMTLLLAVPLVRRIRVSAARQ